MLIEKIHMIFFLQLHEILSLTHPFSHNAVQLFHDVIFFHIAFSQITSYRRKKLFHRYNSVI